jgi:Uma2 family endonuclease
MASIATKPAPLPPPSEPLMTEEGFLAVHGGDALVELLDGVVVRYPMPGRPHGYINANLAFELTTFVKQHRLGRVFINDTFVRIRRNPDRVRGADVVYVGFTKMPPGEVKAGVIDVPPDLIGEVKSPTDSWTDVFTKAEEYFDIGVPVVLLVDPDTRTVLVCRRGQPQQTLQVTDDLTVPDVLPGFSVPVARLFE